MVIVNIIVVLALVLVFVVAFTLFSPLSVRISYTDTLQVYASLSFIKIRLIPKKEKTKAAACRKKKKSTAKKTKKTVSSDSSKMTNSEIVKETQKQSKKPLRETLGVILDIVKSFVEMLGKKATIRIDYLKVVVSKPDAADTAVQFGICNGIVISLLALTSGFGKSVIKDENISVSPDFISGKSSIETDITLSAPVRSLVWSILRGYLKSQFKT